MSLEQLERTLQSVPENLTWAIRELPLRHAASEAQELAESMHLKSEEATLALAVLIQSTLMISPGIENTDGQKAAGYFTVTGGEDAANPHLTVDTISARAYTDQAKYYTHLNIAFRIEEDHAWKTTHPDKPMTHRVVFDPLDGTSDLPLGKFAQSSGIIITHADGSFLAGGFVNLVTQEIFLMEHDSLHRYSLRKSGSAHTLMPQMPEATPPQFQKDTGAIRYATLEKRMKDIRPTQFYINHGEPTLLSFGGFALSELTDQHIDAIIDPFKGQPWFEVVIWGWIAQKMGHTVIDMNGRSIDFQTILMDNSTNPPLDQPEPMNRVCIIIAKSHILFPVEKKRSATQQFQFPFHLSTRY